jgi:hypothetical protein
MTKKRRKASSSSTTPRKLVSPKQNSLCKLAESLTTFDSADLLATFAALQLMPENADRAFRFEVLSHVAASVKSRGFGSKKKINLKQLEKICRCDSAGLESLVSGEDPFDNSFTEAFTFIGGSYIVFPGIVEEPTFTLRHLARALFLDADPFPDVHFREMARAVLMGVLALSNEVARRAGLGRGVDPVSAPRKDVVLPSPERLDQLQQAVSFTATELAALLARHNVALFEIENLILQQGYVSIADYQVDNGELLVRPIVKATDKFIVAIPGMLLSAARNEIIRLALERGVIAELATRYHATVWETVIDSLGYVEHQRVAVSLPESPDIPYFQDAFFGFDSDKLAYVTFVTDALTDYNPQNPFGCWDLKDVGHNLEARLQEICEFAFTQLSGVNEVLFLLVCQGVGRLQMMDFKELPEIQPLLLLGVTAADLETITLLEGGNPLAIWKYVWASWRLEQQAKVMSIGELNKFYFYRAKDYTFYSSDEFRPNLVLIETGGAGDLRREVLRQRDWHAVPSYTSNYVTEVTSLFSTCEIPVYIPRSVLSRVRQRVAVFVEGLPLPTWIVSSEQKDSIQREYRHLYAEFTQTIGYWLWQFTPSLNSLIQALTLDSRVLLIQLFIEQDEAWHHIEERSFTLNKEPIKSEANSVKTTLNVTISSGICSLLRSANNEGERYLMQRVLAGIRDLLPREEQEALSDDVIHTLLDLHAPLGIKKKLFYLEGNLNPELDENGLPNYRKVQEADEDELLDELGDYLSSVENLKVGEIPDGERTTVINKAVDLFYSEFKKLVASLNPEQLLEYLIAYHEAIVRETAFHRMTIPTRLACFSSEPEMIETLSKELPERHKAALTSRFVIEYVVAQPPTGIRPFSLTVYDRLQALASQIVNFGFESDLINFKLTDIKRSMLPSGRLGANKDEYENTRAKYMSIFTGGEIGRATRSFNRHWHRAQKSSEKPSFVAQMDAASAIEFGFSITEIHEMLGEAVRIGRELHPTVAILHLEDLIRRLSEGLGWSLERVNQAIDLLALKPRLDFLKPDPPHQGGDVYPWKFNRGLSYLRRPFLLRKRDGKTEVLWGIRHLNTVSQYLVYLCLNGRLKAKSAQMKQVMSVVRNEQTKEFNDEVADLLEQNPALTVRRRVKKIGKSKIQGEQGVLGDVDVLVIDPTNFSIKVIECKDFALARAPHEMKNELDELFLGRDKKSRREKSAVEHHQERVEWIRSHLSEVLSEFGLDPNATWAVEAMIVTDYELATPHLWSSPIPVVSLSELSKAYL